MSNFTSNPDISGTNIDAEFLALLQGGAATGKIADIYEVYMWNYCSGSKSASGAIDLTFCSPRSASFWFNPVSVWGLNNTGAEQLFPQKLNDGLKAYRAAAHWAFAIYTVAFWATVAELVVGIFALCSRWGSCATTIVSCVSTTATAAGAITITVLYSVLVGTFDTALHPYRIDASLGTHMLATAWLAVVFSTVAGAFWVFSTCCCSGKSESRGRKKVVVEKTPYTYERVASPYLGAGGSNNVPLHHVGPDGAYKGGSGAAYEPYRQV